MTNTLLAHNRLSHNGHDGIDNQAPSGTLTKNIANFSTNLGIESVSRITDGGRNRAHGNGNPVQCTNVGLQAVAPRIWPHRLLPCRS